MEKPSFLAERTKIEKDGGDALEQERDLPPVVARMVVEIRSDGTRTVARGALEDLQNGERVALRAEGTTPLALAGQLTKAILQVPALARDMTESAAREMAQAQLDKLKGKLAPLAQLAAFKRKKKDPQDHG